jgi:hypothetical protein
MSLSAETLNSALNQLAHINETLTQSLKQIQGKPATFIGSLFNDNSKILSDLYELEVLLSNSGEPMQIQKEIVSRLFQNGQDTNSWCFTTNEEFMKMVRRTLRNRVSNILQELFTRATSKQDIEQFACLINPDASIESCKSFALGVLLGRGVQLNANSNKNDGFSGYLSTLGDTKGITTNPSPPHPSSQNHLLVVPTKISSPTRIKQEQMTPLLPTSPNSSDHFIHAYVWTVLKREKRSRDDHSMPGLRGIYGIAFETYPELNFASAIPETSNQNMLVVDSLAVIAILEKFPNQSVAIHLSTKTLPRVMANNEIKNPDIRKLVDKIFTLFNNNRQVIFPEISNDLINKQMFDVAKQITNSI